MNETQITDYRARLLQMLAELDAEDALGAEARGTVTLDQQSVGRLSRMDALQQQSMAKATQARRAAMRQRIAAALERMDEGEFGFCSECGEAIPQGRLALDPTVPTCVNCAQG